MSTKNSDKKEKKLGTRQWWLYRYLLSTTKLGWQTEEEIVDAMANDLAYSGERYEISNNPKGSKCSAIWNDMNEINFSYQVDKIVITNDRRFKMAESKEELESEYLNELHTKAMRSLVRYSAIKRKCDMDKQGKLVSLQGVQIDEESRAKRFIEAFVNDYGE